MNLRTLWPFGRKSAMQSGMLREIIGIMQSKSGETVTVTTAMQVAAVFSCLRVISEGVAQVPLKVYRQKGRNREAAIDHPLYDLLHRKPNDNMSSFSLRETMVIHAALCGGAVAFVNRSSVDRRVMEIIPLEPAHVEAVKPDFLGDPIRWKVRGKNGDWKIFPAEAIWHVPGPSWDGLVGMDILKHARDAIGLSIAAESSQSRLHKNGIQTSGIYSVEGTLTPQQYKDLSKWLKDNASGEASGGPMVLDRNAKWLQTAMTGVDAQHLETRRHQIEEVCRFMRVMPLMIGLSDKAATYASAEQMFLAHVVHTLSPWYERFEQSIDCQLLTDADRKNGYYAKFVIAGLLRGALKDTAEYLYRLVSMGILTRNEAREKLEFNPLDGLDEPLTPINLTGSIKETESGA